MSPFSWLMDFAYCNNMTPYTSLFSQLKPTPHIFNIHTSDGSTMQGHNIVSILTSNLSVFEVFNVPKLSYNLLSVGQVLETGHRVGHMFPVNNLHLPPIAHVSVVAMVSSITSLSLWHARLSHTSFFWVKHLTSRGLLGSTFKENFDCVSCQLGKQSVLPFNNSESMSNNIFDLIHFDVWGTLPVSSIGGLNISLSMLITILTIVGYFI